MSERPTDEADRPDASGRVDTDDDSGQSLPPRPDPVATPQDPPPGGPNAIRGVGGDGAYSTVSHDAPPQDNPATDEVPIKAGFEDMFVAQNARLWAEPGRALCAEYSSLIVKVEKRRGDELYINDGAYGALFDAAHVGWRYSYMLSTAMLLLIIPVLWLRLPNTLPLRRRGLRRPVRPDVGLARRPGRRPG